MGTLFIVATPIGNLKDITLRALEVLKSVDLIVCEDTRVTGRLLTHFEIQKKMIALNDFNEEKMLGSVLSLIESGKNIALVSDAGTPLISDPGYKLVREAIGTGVKIETIPGSSSTISALTVSGKPPDKFLFLGYLPKKPGKRKNTLMALSTILHSMIDKDLRPTVIFFESPYRLLGSLLDLKEIFGDIDIVICRELTKLHEEIRREKVSDSINHFSQVSPKGEFVILF